jgi:hypothetical protein
MTSKGARLYPRPLDHMSHTQSPATCAADFARASLPAPRVLPAMRSCALRDRAPRAESGYNGPECPALAQRTRTACPSSHN